jgi:hypothetical protein
VAGSPNKRRKRESETQRASARAKRFTRADRERILKRSAVVGAAVAAREAGVSPATLRTWRRRGAAEPVEHVVSEPSAAGLVEEVVPAGEEVSGLEAMRRALADAQRVSAQAVAQTEALLAAGQAKDAQAASVAGGVWSDKALALGKALAAAESEMEAESVRLGGEALELQRALLAATFEAMELPVPVATMRELAAHAAAGEPLEVSEEVAVADRQRVRAKMRASVESDIELARYVSRTTPPAAEAEGEGDDAGEEGECADAEPSPAAVEEGREPAVDAKGQLNQPGYVPGGDGTAFRRGGIPREPREPRFAGRMAALRNPNGW